MLRLLGFLYSIGIWGTFAFLIYAHWRSACVGIGNCAVTIGIDFLVSLIWPFFWGGWIH